MRNKIIAYFVGIFCHLSFIIAIGLMAYMLATGLTSGIFPIGGNFGRLLNIVLLVQFPVLHSLLLTSTGRKVLIAPFPKEIGGALVTTTYALVTSLQLLAVFVFWTPDSTVWFAPTHTLLEIWIILYIFSWLFLIKALSEAGMAMHTGSLGWWSIVTGKPVKYPAIPTSGLHRECRHPIYLSFSLIILTAPVWSFDHFVLACIWVMYCVVAPKFKERRLHQRLGANYKAIQSRVPYLIPRRFHIRSFLNRIEKQ